MNLFPNGSSFVSRLSQVMLAWIQDPYVSTNLLKCDGLHLGLHLWQRFLSMPIPNDFILELVGSLWKWGAVQLTWLVLPWVSVPNKKHLRSLQVSKKTSKLGLISYLHWEHDTPSLILLLAQQQNIKCFPSQHELHTSPWYKSCASDGKKDPDMSPISHPSIQKGPQGFDRL